MLQCYYGDSAMLSNEALLVPLTSGAMMSLRLTELELVLRGLGEFDSSETGDRLTIARALERLPARDRAPAWELAVRRFGRHKSPAQAAADAGIDEVRAVELLDAFSASLSAVPPPEADPSAELEESTAARVMSAEMLGNAIAHGEHVDLDAAHEAALQAAEEAEQERRAS
jgi:hypothetical protein